MKYDVILFEGDNLADYNDIDTQTIQFHDVSEDDLLWMMRLAAREQNMFVCCLPRLGAE